MNEVITRLKKSIDNDLLARVDKSLMGELMFVPIRIKHDSNNQKDFLYVAVCQNSDMDKINHLLKKSFNNPIKFMNIGKDDIVDLLQNLIPPDAINFTPDFAVMSARCSASIPPNMPSREMSV